ncbi:MAG: PHP domain-containing protein [Terriglobales bacterium]|jgi:hypothetical protein
MPDFIQGTFHFHSTYSHDGRSTLPEIASSLSARGLSFCVMTEHFEDFDALKFDRYVQELKDVSASSGFLFIPGIEVHLSGLDTIIFPVRKYEEIARFEAEGKDSQPPMFKVLAHPSKYRFQDVMRHLTKYQLNGIELWNQQADGSYIPPIDFLELLKSQAQRNHFRYFFGCDLHSANLTVANVLSVPSPNERTAEAIAKALIEGDFVSRNCPTGIEYRNGSGKTDFDAWLQTLRRKSYSRGKILRSVRHFLRSLYRMLPRDTQHSLNDFKNFVRNKV